MEEQKVDTGAILILSLTLGLVMALIFGMWFKDDAEELDRLEQTIQRQEVEIQRLHEECNASVEELYRRDVDCIECESRIRELSRGGE